MKRILSVFIAVVLLFSLSGCKSNETGGSSSDISSEEVSSNETSSDTPSEISSLEDEPSSNQKPTSGENKISSQSGTKPPTSSTAPRETVSLTFVEGSSLAKMMAVLEQYGVAKKADLLKAVNEYDFSYYPLVSQIKASSSRCFKLEGYLFPDTYQFYKGEKPQDAIGRFLKVAEKKITKEYRDRAAALGYSMDEILNIASIVEKEVGDAKERPTVASVFYNRLNAGQKLQSDATINYVEKSIKPFISGDINRYNSFYNTYKCKALPAGPICNPGVSAIKAALYPADTDYFYFASDKDGNYLYAKTYEEHLQNCEAAGISTD